MFAFLCYVVFSAGQMRKDAATVYGEGTGDILLDDVKCDGDEPNIAECQHKFWRDTDCAHKEDVGCICKAAATNGAGICEQSHHRITPFNMAYPGIGRAELQDTNGKWWTICDDHWDDINAAIFCDCLGYARYGYFHFFLCPI